MTDLVALADVELLGPQHDRSQFKSGNQRLDDYLKQRSSQEQRRGVAAVYVIRPVNSNEVVGFYTLSNYAVIPELFPSELRKKLPRYPTVPATLIGWLASSNGFAGKSLRIGETLLVDALMRAWSNRKTVASMAVIVDADPDVVNFYTKYGFISFPEKPSKLFITMDTIGKLHMRVKPSKDGPH